MATNAVYKIYNGSSWVEYHLKTSAAQVVMTNARKFITSDTKVNGVAFTLGSSDNTATVTINGTHITGSATAVSGSSLQYIGTNDTVAVALGKLDKAAKDAHDAIPSGVLTTSNYASTLGSVYAAIGHNHSGTYQPLDADLTAIAALTGTAGFLKKTAANTWSLDTTTYVPTSRTVNGKALSNNITLKASDIGWNNAVGFSATNVEDEITNLWIAANGITRGYGISTATTGTNVVNGQFSTNAGERSFTITDTLTNGASAKKITLLNSTVTVLLSSLKVGDNIFIDDERMPDWWVSGVDANLINNSITVTFSILETQTVNLSNYATKGTTLAHYGITDAKIVNGVITLGSNTITPLTQHQDISGKAPNNHASSNTTYGLGTSSVYGHVKLVTGDLNGKSAADGMAASQSHTHSQYLTSHQSLSGYATQTWVGQQGYVKCTAGATAPSSPSTGDIWIDTNN